MSSVGVSPQVMVGDNLLKDIQGAQDAGLEYQRKNARRFFGELGLGWKWCKECFFLNGWIDPEMGRPFFFWRDQI